MLANTPSLCKYFSGNACRPLPAAICACHTKSVRVSSNVAKAGRPLRNGKFCESLQPEAGQRSYRCMHARINQSSCSRETNWHLKTYVVSVRSVCAEATPEPCHAAKVVGASQRAQQLCKFPGFRWSLQASSPARQAAAPARLSVHLELASGQAVCIYPWPWR